jgi:hypothetical protein
MSSTKSIKEFFSPLVPAFLRENYSPYKCKVSSNKENYDLTGRIWHLKNLIKTTVNLKRLPFPSPIQCRDCLFDTRLPNIYIWSDGVCNMCHTYKEKFDAAILENEVKDFMSRKREPGAQYDAVIAYSGGKDSTVSLSLAVNRYHLKVMAVLVDNGFIPQEVIDNSQRICDDLDVPLRVVRAEFASQLNELMKNNFSTGYPCYACTILFHDVITRVCVEEKVNRVITGRNWWRMLDPVFSAVKVIQPQGTDLKVEFLSLPFALQLKETDEPPYLEQVGWTKVKSVYGHSTNCLVPGLVEKTAYDRIGYHPELNLVSREVICGFLTKEKGLEKISTVKDLSRELRELVNEKLKTSGRH